MRFSSHSWVYPAQAHIFRRFLLNSPDKYKHARNDCRWTRFLEAMKASPHLIQHLRKLDVRFFQYQISSETFIAICNYPFTHFDGAYIKRSRLQPPCTGALQQLLFLPTLRRLHLHCKRPNPSVTQIWDRGSPGLTHLELSYRSMSLMPFSSIQHFPSPIRLESLDLFSEAE
ncbi:hypothetical protein C8R44DRAFT_856335, partial [Mycena epipterygia]